MSTRTLARLKKDMKAAGVTQDQVAAEADVSRTHVSHVLAGRFKSRKVLDTAARLLEKAIHAAA